MWNKLLLSLLGLSVAGLAAVIVVERTRERKNAVLLEDLLAAAESPPARTLSSEEVTDLPPPIQRYLAHVLPEEPPSVRAVRIEQQGTFRSGGAASEWSSFTATEHVTIQPPGFVWDASIEMFPWVPVRVVDAYHDGRGALWARLGSVLSVADMAPSPELDEGELMRYLAEAPLYPTALLPGGGVTWTPIDGRSARATLEHRGTTASLVFHVNDRDEVERVMGHRAFAKDDGTFEYRPWTGYWRNYEIRNGVRVPLDGEVAWVYPAEGEVSYWRGHMAEIEYLSDGPDGSIRTAGQLRRR